MKVFQINDCDCWVGESLESCVADYLANYDGDPDSVEDAYEINDSDLDIRKITIEESEDGQGTTDYTFREWLAKEIEAGGDFPRMFSTTDR